MSESNTISLNDLSHSCPSTFLPILEPVFQVKHLQDLIDHKHWKKDVDKWLDESSPKQGNEIWRFFWNCIDLINRRGVKGNEELSIFLLLGCRDIYAGRWTFSSPNPVLPRLLPIAETVNQDDISEPLSNALSEAVVSNSKFDFSRLSVTVGESQWSFDDGDLVFGGKLSVRVPVDRRFGSRVEFFEELRKICRFANSSEESFRLSRFLHETIEKKWNDLRHDLLKIWADEREEECWSRKNISSCCFIDFYSFVREDQKCFEYIIERIDLCYNDLTSADSYNRDDYRSKFRYWCDTLSWMHLPGIDISRVLLEKYGPDSNSVDRIELSECVFDKIWGCGPTNDPVFFISLYYHEKMLSKNRNRPKDRWVRISESIKNIDKIDFVGWIVERFEELPSSDYYSRRSELLSRSDERAAWRMEILDRVKGKQEYQRIVIEFFLWWSTGTGADEAELLVITLCEDPSNIDFVRSLLSHPSRKVQLRSRAIIALLEKDFSQFSTSFLSSSERSVSRTIASLQSFGDPPKEGHTWIDDRTVEEMLVGAISRAEGQFCREYPDQWGHEEERLVGRLLEYLRQELGNVNRTIRDALSQGFGSPVSIDLQYRETTKSEEGAEGVGTDTFGVDIALILRVAAEGVVESERAVFIQAKKLERRKDDGPWEPSFKIKPGQRDDLIEQSESSFYLFLAPPMIREECWMLPARFVRNIMECRRTKVALEKNAVSRGARSLSHWLVYDVIGLWTGDERPEIIQKAEGDHKGRKPRFLVAVTVRKGKRHSEEFPGHPT
ncbi:MAG: hypothetical protein HQL56_18580 [Magnetococcales bacterium]|nr:hypothetical protein [Magnetococcales bacterium]